MSNLLKSRTRPTRGPKPRIEVVFINPDGTVAARRIISPDRQDEIIEEDEKNETG